MKEDVKAKLKAKLVGDEELDNVAGGSFSENQDILVALGDIDPEGTKNLLKNWDQKAPNRASTLASMLGPLLNRNLKGTKLNFGFSDGNNLYYLADDNGNMQKRLSHDEFMTELKKMGWEIM